MGWLRELPEQSLKRLIFFLGAVIGGMQCMY